MAISSVSTTINVADPCTVTPGTYTVKAYYTEVDAGHAFGPFSSREVAEKCVLALAARDGVIKAVVEEVV